MMWSHKKALFKGLVQMLAIVLILLASVQPAMAETVEATIDLSDQRLRVAIDGHSSYDWAISTARPGYVTPIGVYHPIRLEREWYSIKYDNAPMPFSVFFHGGYAIHGTTEIAHLGQPASHGCVRLHPDHAAVLFDLVTHYGRADTLIRVVR
ncbi:MAG: L,D-transpeptidase [Alphaproteobacteria bacterium]